MTTKTKAARRSGNYDTRLLGASMLKHAKDAHIVSDYGRGALIAGLLTAIAFGLCLVHWAVM